MRTDVKKYRARVYYELIPLLTFISSRDTVIATLRFRCLLRTSVAALHVASRLFSPPLLLRARRIVRRLHRRSFFPAIAQPSSAIPAIWTIDQVYFFRRSFIRFAHESWRIVSYYRSKPGGKVTTAAGISRDKKKSFTNVWRANDCGCDVNNKRHAYQFVLMGSNISRQYYCTSLWNFV